MNGSERKAPPFPESCGPGRWRCGPTRARHSRRRAVFQSRWKPARKVN